MASGTPEGIVVSPAGWPAVAGDVHPGDLAQFAPQGFGLGAPMIVTPYGTPSGSGYGFDGRDGHPFRDAPLAAASGGTLYFDHWADSGTLASAFTAMGIYSTTAYLAYMSSSRDPVADRYLDQLRLITHRAAQGLYRPVAGVALPAQAIDLQQAVLAFVAAQKTKWNDDYAYPRALAGTAGGDGDWAKESLAFGFHVENSYWGIYRVWSRPWLVTK